MLAQTSTISRISVNSKKNSHKTKASPSSSSPESPECNSNTSNSRQSYEQYWSTQTHNHKLKMLQNTVDEMQDHQAEMEEKFKSCIEQMLKQIEMNNEANSKLAVEVNRMKTDISQSKKDILIIEEYLQTGPKKDLKKSMGEQKNTLNRHSSGRDLLGRLSGSKNILMRRQPSKAFKSKLFPKQ